MGGDLTFAGGSGGVTARLDDLRAASGLLDHMGEDFGEVAATLGKVAIGGDLIRAATLCPVEVARAEAAIAVAEVDAGGAVGAWMRLEGRAAYLRMVIEVYRDLDRVLTEVEEVAWQAAGFAASTLALPVALVALHDPLVDLALWERRKTLVTGMEETLYDEPWLQEALTRGGPGLVQGAVFALTGSSIGLVNVLSGGKWPTVDFPTAVGGLLAIAERAGVLRDTGAFQVQVAGPRTVADFSQRRFAGAVLEQQRELSEARATIQVVSIDGGRSYVVQIPGTQEWGPKRGDNPLDTSSNVRLMAGENAVLTQAVIDAMHAANIPPDAPVMLTGHSQGGIVAATIAADPHARAQFNIRSVLTAGSPIARVPLPAEVSVLSLEASQDIVPKLDGADNPDRLNWITVTHDLRHSSAPDSRHDLAAAHSLANYAQLGEVLDASAGTTMTTWRESNAVFFGVGSVQRFHLVPSVG